MKSSVLFLKNYTFLLLLVIAVVISNIPIISIPFNWLETFFHELSHGIAAIVTGGRIVKIELFPNGAGLCTTQGGSRFFISLMGYLGAALWGASIFSLAKLNRQKAKLVIIALILLLACSIILWVRDFLTLFIVAVLIALFFVKLTLDKHYIQWLLKLTGLLVLLNAVLSPLHLLDGRRIGDGAALASITYIPETIWVALWSILGVLILFQLGKRR